MNLGQIRAAARDLLDETTADFWTDADLNRYINRGYRYYWVWMVEQAVPGTLKRATFNIVSGTATIALPSDWAKTHRLERVFGTYTRPLSYLPRFDIPNVTSGNSVSTTNYLPSYDYEGSNIILQPTPSLSVTGGLLMTYFYTLTDLSADNETPNVAFQSLYHDLLVLYCVVAAKRKEENVLGEGTNIGSFVIELKEWEQKFKDSLESPTNARQFVEAYGLDREYY